ncbi:MAG: SusC/RagA family TonB-linked outer membrane protein [Capnocytophaga sp.]|nr:SusC/RagA family TonB-linked outer membrane protein [Capnocytophaga sp.]
MKYIFYSVLAFFLLINFSYAQQSSRVISGRVIAASDKQPLMGAAIAVPSKSAAKQTREKDVITSISLGTVTDLDGNFTLKVPNDVTEFTVSFLGFETKVVHLTDKDSFHEIALVEVMNDLEGVLVTSYQKIEARKLTAAITKVEAKEIMQAGVASIDQLLVGQVAGMQTTIATGAPGEIAKIRIRGTASLQGTKDPLWVVDGLPLEDNEVPDFKSDLGSLTASTPDAIDELRSYSIAGINPDDIEDITILKDAAATAIYGARAANGVIVITTKKGKKGAMNVSLSTNTFVGFTPNLDRLNLMNASEKVDFELAMARRADLTGAYQTSGEVYRILTDAYATTPNSELDSYQTTGVISAEKLARINQLRNVNTDWGKLIFRDSFNKQHNISISGGSDAATYYFSLGYYDEEGVTIGTGLKRYTLTAKNSFKINDKLKINTTILGTQSNRDSYLTGTGMHTNPLHYSRKVNPYLTPYDSYGNYVYDQDVVASSSASRYIPYNLLEERNNTSHTQKNLSLKGVIDVEYEILKGLTYNSQLGVQLDRGNTEKYSAWDSYVTRYYKYLSEYNNRTAYYLPDGDMINKTNSEFFQYNWKNNLQYGLNIDNMHEIDLFVGSEIRRTNSLITYERVFGYDPLTLTSQPIILPSVVTEFPEYFKVPKRSEVENAYVSFYGTASYTHNRRYTLFGSIRYDGSNLFGVDPKYRYLPIWAISGAWTASEEDFLRDNKYISFLRIKAGYGMQGNVDRSTSPFIKGVYDNVTIAGLTVPTISISRPPNEYLRWETTHNYDLGIEASFFDQRVRISAEFYRRISKDLLGNRDLALETGFSSSLVNWAEMTNKGYDLTLSTENIRTPKFRWNTTFTLSRNTNVVNKVQAPLNSIYPSLEGYPVNAVFVFKTNGLDANGIPIFVDKNGNSAASAVEFFNVDTTKRYGLSKYTNEEIANLMTYAGSSDPEFVGGFTNTFRYGNFDLTVASNFVINQTVTRTPPYAATTIYRGSNMSREVLNAWTPENTNTTLPRIIGSSTVTQYDYYVMNGLTNVPQIYNNLDIWTKKMSYLRVSSIRFGYNLPDDLVKKLSLKSLRLSLEGRNLFVISKDYTGYFDPETYGNIYAQPIQKSVSLGLNLTL